MTEVTNIINSVSSADLNVTELIDPATMQFYASNMATQINDSRWSHAARVGLPQKRVVDLYRWITDIIIETTAQGASLLEVHVIDPLWWLFTRDPNGTCFIDADEDGFLWPPIEVTFPPDISDSTWRLARVQPSTDLSSANVILVFEDKIASQLREHYGRLSSNSGETRAEFIQRLVKTSNDHPAFPTDVPIKFVPLLPKETFTAADLTGNPPKSATQPHPPPARRHHKKPPHHTAPYDPLPSVGQGVGAVSQAASGISISIEAGLNAFVAHTGLQGVPFGEGGFPVGVGGPSGI